MHETLWEENLTECLQLTSDNLQLDQRRFSGHWSRPRSAQDNSYYILKPQVSEYGAEAESPEDLPAERDGAAIQVTRNVYERKLANRRACIAHHRTTEGRIYCNVCGMDFVGQYGEVGRGFIHIHHIHPLGQRQAPEDFDPRIHLVPVCPNCHAMLHKKPGNGAFDVDELKAMMPQIL